MDLFSDILVGGDLAATSTKARRSWHWVANRDPGQSFAGTLTIRQQGGKGVNCKAEVDSYAVELLPPLPGFIGRRFLLTNLSDPDAAEVYETQVGFRPGEWTCTCKAGQYKAPSDKHADALRAAMLAGAFEDAEQPEPVAPNGPWVVRT